MIAGRRVPAALAVALPTALLLSIAVVQVSLARTMRLSPWKGGGFGMFASVDGQAFRWVRVYVAAPDRSEELLVPPSLEDLAARVSTFPHEAALERFGRAVAAREHRHGRPVETVKIEIWRAEYSPQLAAAWAPLVAHTISVHGAAGSDR